MHGYGSFMRRVLVLGIVATLRILTAAGRLGVSCVAPAAQPSTDLPGTCSALLCKGCAALPVGNGAIWLLAYFAPSCLTKVLSSFPGLMHR